MRLWLVLHGDEEHCVKEYKGISNLGTLCGFSTGEYKQKSLPSGVLTQSGILSLSKGNNSIKKHDVRGLRILLKW